MSEAAVIETKEEKSRIESLEEKIKSNKDDFFVSVRLHKTKPRKTKYGMISKTTAIELAVYKMRSRELELMTTRSYGLLGYYATMQLTVRGDCQQILWPPKHGIIYIKPIQLTEKEIYERRFFFGKEMERLLKIEVFHDMIDSLAGALKTY